MKGKRFDKGKSRIDLVPPEAIFALGDALDYGQTKYGERNWEKGMAWGRVFGSLMRHCWKFWSGEDIDKESGRPHVDLILTNAAFLCTYYHRKIGKDDRAVLASRKKRQ